MNCRRYGNIAVDIGNTRLKCSVLVSGAPVGTSVALPLPKGNRVSKKFVSNLSSIVREWEDWEKWVWDNPKKDPIESGNCKQFTWLIAQTGSFSWRVLKTEILKIRPNDQFTVITRQQIPVNIDVDFPEKVGMDRLLAAATAVKRFGNVPMLVVDAGTAVTIDVVQNGTFCGGAILPGMQVLAKTYPKISGPLPVVAIPGGTEKHRCMLPHFPGKNTEDAIHSGIYWGTIGAISQYCSMFFSKKKDYRIILTGGDAPYLLTGLQKTMSSVPMIHVEWLVLEGIHQIFE